MWKQMCICLFDCQSSLWMCEYLHIDDVRWWYRFVFYVHVLWKWIEFHWLFDSGKLWSDYNTTKGFGWKPEFLMFFAYAVVFQLVVLWYIIQTDSSACGQEHFHWLLKAQVSIIKGLKTLRVCVLHIGNKQENSYLACIIFGSLYFSMKCQWAEGHLNCCLQKFVFSRLKSITELQSYQANP